jgi:hypothetical protein
MRLRKYDPEPWNLKKLVFNIIALRVPNHCHQIVSYISICRLYI